MNDINFTIGIVGTLIGVVVGFTLPFLAKALEAVKAGL